MQTLVHPNMLLWWIHMVMFALRLEWARHVLLANDFTYGIADPLLKYLINNWPFLCGLILISVTSWYRPAFLLDAYRGVLRIWNESIFIAVLLCSLTLPYSSAINTLYHAYRSRLLLWWPLLEFAVFSLADSGLGASIHPPTNCLRTFLKLNVVCSVKRLFHRRQPLLLMVRVCCCYDASDPLRRVTIRCSLRSMWWWSRIVCRCCRPLPWWLVLRFFGIDIDSLHLI